MLTTDVLWMLPSTKGFRPLFLTERISGLELEHDRTPNASLRFDSPEQEAFLHLWRTYDCLKALEEQLFSKFDLSAQQYNALRLLRSAHPHSMRTLTLARRLISRSPDITRMLDRLEAAGLITRERKSENRRVVEVLITKNGISLLKKLGDKVREMHDKQLAISPLINFSS